MQTFFWGPGTLSDLAKGEGRICDGIVNWLESVADNDNIVVKVVAGTFCHLLDAIALELDSVDDQDTRHEYDSLKSNLHRDFDDFSKAGMIMQLDDELENETIWSFPLTAMVKQHTTGRERFWDASYRYTAAAAISSTLYKICSRPRPKISFVAISSRASSRGKMIPPKSPTSFQYPR